jgi:hypothetical protein
MQQPDTHASQLFNIKALPRLLKTVAEKSIATAPQVSHHYPAIIVQNAENVQEELAPQPATSASLSSSTTADITPKPPVISRPSAPTSQRQHHMITHELGKLKPKVFISS